MKTNTDKTIAASLLEVRQEIARLQQLATAYEKVLEIQKSGAAPKVKAGKPAPKEVKQKKGKRPKAPTGTLERAISEVLDGDGKLTGGEILAALRTNNYKYSLNNLGPTLTKLSEKGKIVLEGDKYGLPVAK
jgi:hypothetical protein